MDSREDLFFCILEEADFKDLRGRVIYGFYMKTCRDSV